MADPAMAAARAVDALTDEALPGLPMTSVDRIEDDLLAELRLCGCGCGVPTGTISASIVARGYRKGEQYRFLKGHNHRTEPLSAKWEVTAGGCWEWRRAIGPSGYGQIVAEGRSWRAHRYVYQKLVGPIPDGLQLDHLCRVRHCVNPAHLEPVTQRVNVLRGHGAAARSARATHCPQGHPYDDANTRLTAKGHRLCIICTREQARVRQARYQARKRSA